MTGQGDRLFRADAPAPRNRRVHVAQPSRPTASLSYIPAWRHKQRRSFSVVNPPARASGTPFPPAPRPVCQRLNFRNIQPLRSASTRGISSGGINPSSTAQKPLTAPWPACE